MKQLLFCWPSSVSVAVVEATCHLLRTTARAQFNMDLILHWLDITMAPWLLPAPTKVHFFIPFKYETGYTLSSPHIKLSLFHLPFPAYYSFFFTHTLMVTGQLNASYHKRDCELQRLRLSLRSCMLPGQWRITMFTVFIHLSISSDLGWPRPEGLLDVQGTSQPYRSESNKLC